MQYRGKSALVTGASSGIGEAFARALAGRGMALLLAGRSEERLQTIAEDLTTRHGVRVETISIDLAERAAPRHLQEAADGHGFEPDLLVNNAGVGVLAPFADVALERQLEQVRLNVESLVALTGLYLPRMLARRSGGVINVASSAAFQPVPYFAVYAASKAFVLSFSEGLWAETRRHGVRVVAVAPGPVADTRFGERAEMKSAFDELRAIPREQVVAEALRALERGRPSVVPGLTTGIGARAVRFIPRRLQLVVTERLFRRYAHRP